MHKMYLHLYMNNYFSVCELYNFDSNCYDYHILLPPFFFFLNKPFPRAFCVLLVEMFIALECFSYSCSTVLSQIKFLSGVERKIGQRDTVKSCSICLI